MSPKNLAKPKNSDLDKHRHALLEALLAGDSLRATKLVDEAISNKWEPSSIYVNIVGHSMAEIGAMWHRGRLTIAEEHRATQIAFRLLAHAQASYITDHRVGLKAIVTAVEGDQHMVGGLTFADLLRFEGWDVDYLGADMPIEDLYALVESTRPDLLGLSVTLPESLDSAMRTVERVKSNGFSPTVVVGGGALTENIFRKRMSEVGADFVSSNSLEAVEWILEKFDLGFSARTLDAMLADIGQRIQSLRKERGISQGDLAKSASLDRSYISAVEHGKQNVSFATLKAIADSLKVPITELIDED
jgi:methanogenic corrinoid protein MtbC1/DNA-binding XRE family transcriptional regulator